MTGGVESGSFLAQSKKAVAALIKHESRKSRVEKVEEKGKVGLLEEERATKVYLVINFLKISSEAKLKPIRIPVPHPFRKAELESSNICLFTKDPQRQYKDRINPLGLKSIVKIVGISKLKEKYKPYEARRLLANSYDLFLSDSSLIPLMPNLLGKAFLSKKKQPIPVQMKSEDDDDRLKSELKNAIESVYFYQTAGCNTSIVIGTNEQKPEELAENMEAVIKALGKKIGGGLKSVRSIMVKTDDSVHLPIYVRGSVASTKKDD